MSMLRELPMDDFLERIQCMPDIEALQEIRMRRDDLSAHMAMLSTTLHDLKLEGRTKASPKVTAAGHAIAVVNADLTRIKEAIRECNVRLDRLTWAKAVTAVYGQEGYERCRLWMFANDPERAENYKGLERLAEKYGVTL